MFSVFLFLLFCAIAALWILLASLRAKRIWIPADFWLLYIITLMIGVEIPKVLAIGNKSPLQHYLWYLYTYSNNLVALLLFITGLHFLLRPQAVVHGLKDSAIAKLPIAKKRKDDIGTARLLGGFMSLGGGLIIFLNYPSLVAQAWRTVQAIFRL